MRKAWLAVLGAAWLAAVPAAAQDDIAKQIINEPSPAAFTIYGLPEKPKVRKDASVQGGQALRVAVPGKGATPYAVGLSAPVKKAIRKGDKLVLAFWARFDKAEGTSVTIANVSVQLATAPYTSFFAKGVDIGPEWKLYSVEGVADRDYAAGELAVAMHLATGKQVIDLGPIFLLDLNL
ncbi:hypothetical protein IAG41_20105 [Sphingomonas sp. JC676]|uniref:hypothetical protein n=1 Tax=Sphingomonas sp. JC676 TaxID=2768065 RepID=UPI001657780A|nr:hypothetical protein [Sphingomonas sp. JC676]MBC9034699.1 hypothetical protein [Sphingomonas sp. JC676]